MKRIYSLVGLMALSVSCASEKKQASDSAPERRVSLPVSFQLKADANLTERERSILAELNSVGSVSASLVAEALLERHVNYFESTRLPIEPHADLKDFEEWIDTLSAATLGTKNPHQLKIAYEADLDQMLAPSHLQYSEKARTVVHGKLFSALQCYSGTTLFELIYQKKRNHLELRLTPFDENRVVIFEAGHALPGYVLRTPSGFRLYGIETTVSGLGIKDFGPTSQIEQPIRVIDSGHFMWVETFKQHLSPESVPGLVAALVQDAADRYEINSKKLEAMIVSARGKKIATSKGIGMAVIGDESWNPGSIASSPLGFGSAEVPPGKIDRIHRDALPIQGTHSFLDPNEALKLSMSPSKDDGRVISGTAVRMDEKVDFEEIRGTYVSRVRFRDCSAAKRALSTQIHQAELFVQPLRCSSLVSSRSIQGVLDELKKEELDITILESCEDPPEQMNWEIVYQGDERHFFAIYRSLGHLDCSAWGNY